MRFLTQAHCAWTQRHTSPRTARLRAPPVTLTNRKFDTTETHPVPCCSTGVSRRPACPSPQMMCAGPSHHDSGHTGDMLRCPRATPVEPLRAHFHPVQQEIQSAVKWIPPTIDRDRIISFLQLYADRPFVATLRWLLCLCHQVPHTPDVDCTKFVTAFHLARADSLEIDGARSRHFLERLQVRKTAAIDDQSVLGLHYNAYEAHNSTTKLGTRRAKTREVPRTKHRNGVLGAGRPQQEVALARARHCTRTRADRGCTRPTKTS